MGKTIEFRSAEADLVVAALLSMACPLCPLHGVKDCGSEPVCRRLAEQVAGGELSEIYGHGGE